MKTILIYYGIACISFCFGFFVCSLFSICKISEKRAIKNWDEEYEGKEVMHDGKNYIVKL